MLASKPGRLYDLPLVYKEFINYGKIGIDKHPARKVDSPFSSTSSHVAVKEITYWSISMFTIQYQTVVKHSKEIISVTASPMAK